MVKQFVSVMALLLSSATIRAEEGKLAIGDPAPGLAVKEFVKGEPVKSFEKGKIYVIEFWAINCPPCRAVMPHTSKLLKKFPGVICIGVNIDAGKKDKYTDIKPFVEKMGDKMNYRVAVDGESVTADGGRVTGIMEKTWLYPVGLGAVGLGSSIPWAFIVDGDGKIAWIGGPDELEKPLEGITAGKRGRTSESVEKLIKGVTKIIKDDVDHEKFWKDFKEAEKAGDSKRVKVLIERAIKDNMADKKELMLFKYRTLTNIEKDPKKQLVIIEQAMLEFPENWDLMLAKLGALSKQTDQVEEAVALGTHLIDSRSRYKESSQDKAIDVINIAWSVIGFPGETKTADAKIHPKLAQLTLQAALRADELIKGMEREDDCGGEVDDDIASNISDTLALAYFLNGDAAKAVESQERALRLSVIQSETPELKKRLEQYKAAAKKLSPR